MGRLIGLLIAVAAIIIILVYFGFLQVSPEGEQAIDDAADSVGEAVENTGEAIQGEAADGN
ncbi:hypothetical protein ROJ8625_03817 [Roseivivax jejudonensis]|uniref:Uncharacterized protein n=1 Tax=Roseivivax jejudonensis TaxID=1529041 RepID=A0A1X7A769_9RHOB|nr:hypothetical protein [Roseivivax jejudonensis]SLN72335.1 hypothetical protein ROJ8625_03817 [Roseivivax jejudonensis]